MKTLTTILISILLTGCASILPLPLDLLNNAHTLYTIANNFDDDPNNNGYVMDTLNKLEMSDEGLVWKKKDAK